MRLTNIYAVEKISCIIILRFLFFIKVSFKSTCEEVINVRDQ